MRWRPIPPRATPQSALFACGMNSIRSPMASELDARAVPENLRGVGRRAQNGPDPFAIIAMEEIGRDIRKHRPRTLDELEDLKAYLDLIVTLSPEAHHKALELTRTVAADVEYWPTPDPAATEGAREQRLDAYRGVRDGLMERIRRRFGTVKSAA